MTHALLVKSGGGLGAGWLLLLVLPGALAAHPSWRAGVPQAAIRESVLAGVITAHFATALTVAVLVIGLLTTDWVRYAAQVGPEAAAGVREAVLPATITAAAITAAIIYAGCALAGCLGAIFYVGVRTIANRY